MNFSQVDEFLNMLHTRRGKAGLDLAIYLDGEPVYRRQLGMADEQPYFNSGVLLVNLAKWRQDGTEQTILGYYRDMGGNLVAPDQDAINGAIPGRILQLPPRYNFGSVQIYYPWKAQRKMSAPTPFMSEEDYRRGTEKPAILARVQAHLPTISGFRPPVGLKSSFASWPASWLSIK